jgi:hypothetical protein
MVLLSAAFALATAVPQQKLPYLDADTPGEAVVMAALEERMIEETRKYCAKALPADKRGIDYAAGLWLVNNRDELTAVASAARARDPAKFDAQLASTIDKAMAAFAAAASVATPERACGGFAESLRTGERNIGSRTPRVSAFLKDYLKDHPLPEKDRIRRSYRLACTMKAFNAEVDLDTARSACSCQADATVDELSEADFAEVDAVAAAGGDAAALPAMQRLAPRLAACGSASPGDASR